MFVHSEEQLPAWWKQHGRSAGGGEADEAEGAGDTALVQRDAGLRHWAQPALAGNTHTHCCWYFTDGPAVQQQESYTCLFCVSVASYVPWQQHRWWWRPLEGIPEEERHERAAGQTDDGQTEGGPGPGRAPRGQTESPAAGEPGQTYCTTTHCLVVCSCLHFTGTAIINWDKADHPCTLRKIQ